MSLDNYQNSVTLESVGFVFFFMLIIPQSLKTVAVGLGLGKWVSETLWWGKY